MCLKMPGDLEFLIRISVAFGLGSLIGLERQFHQRGAGLRTTALVATGSAMFVFLSYHFDGLNETSPSRIAAGVVTGVGFLGAGVILREGFALRGLTTAATIWCAAAVGTLAGVGLLRFAFYGALAVLCANVMLRPLSQFIDRRRGDDDTDADP